MYACIYMCVCIFKYVYECLHVCVCLPVGLGSSSWQGGVQGILKLHKKSKKEVEYIRVEKHRSENYVKLERIDRMKCMEVKWI